GTPLEFPSWESRNSAARISAFRTRRETPPWIGISMQWSRWPRSWSGPCWGDHPASHESAPANRSAPDGRGGASPEGTHIRLFKPYVAPVLVQRNRKYCAAQSTTWPARSLAGLLRALAQIPGLLGKHLHLPLDEVGLQLQYVLHVLRLHQLTGELERARDVLLRKCHRLFGRVLGAFAGALGLPFHRLQ